MSRLTRLLRGPRRRRCAAFAALLIVASAGALAQMRPAEQGPYAVWVYLDPAAAASPDAAPALSPQALARRQAQRLTLLPEDRPIPDTLLRSIAQTGATIRTRSRWLRAVSVDATTAQLKALHRLAFVTRIVPVGKLIPTAVTGGRGQLEPGAGAGPPNDSSFYGVNYSAIARLGIPQAHDLGLTGAGVRIAILDTGFERQHESLSQRLVGGLYDFINGDTTVSNQPGEVDQERHGTQVWSLLGGFAPSLIVGPAYNAVFYLAKVDAEPGDKRVDEDRWVAGAEWADSMGAQIISSSSAFRFDFTDRVAIPFAELNGDITPTTRAADEAARRGILVVQSMGNAEPADGSLSAPADADSIIAVGAVDLDGQLVDFGGTTSGRGPTSDGRIKPELVAPAASLAGASSVTLVGLDYSLSGTSFATPLVAGAAALFMEAWPGLSPMAVRRALLLSGHNARSPNVRVGWGIPDVGAAIMMPEGLSTSGIAPRDGFGNLQSLAPVFSWNAPLISPLVLPLSYVLELATDSLMQTVVVSDTVHDALNLALHRTLLPGSSYWWRVTALGRAGIRRISDVAGPFVAPHWVTLLTLAGDQPTFTDVLRPTLEWQPLLAPAPVGPLTFDVQVLAHASGEVVQQVRNLSQPKLQLPSQLSPNLAYRWRVIAHTPAGGSDTVTTIHPFVVNSAEAPPATLLYQNFPNPFPRWDLGSTSTSIWFDLAENSPVQLTVHDLRGRLVRSLIPSRPTCGRITLQPGVYGRIGQSYDAAGCVLTKWDGTDDDGQKAPAGVYVLRLIAGGKPLYRRMLYQPN